VEDPYERTLPPLPSLRFTSIETGEEWTVDKTSYQENRSRWQEELKTVARRLQIDLLTLSTGGGYEEALISFFKARSRHLNI